MSSRGVVPTSANSSTSLNETSGLERPSHPPKPGEMAIGVIIGRALAAGRTHGPSRIHCPGFHVAGAVVRAIGGLGRTITLSGAAITTDMAWLIGAAFTPLTVLTLSNMFGSYL
ncbi:hypothetical protein [Burkholderia alba]|uniref:hypothetical protein n=1 Tax=Burkholderia alba TaxID=2683677 RepID=UPI002B05884C|nr:hypothetical protein [Burkholderia alba]